MELKTRSLLIVLIGLVVVISVVLVSIITSVRKDGSSKVENVPHRIKKFSPAPKDKIPRTRDCFIDEDRIRQRMKERKKIHRRYYKILLEIHNEGIVLQNTAKQEISSILKRKNEIIAGYRSTDDLETGKEKNERLWGEYAELDLETSLFYLKYQAEKQKLFIREKQVYMDEFQRVNAMSPEEKELEDKAYEFEQAEKPKTVPINQIDSDDS